MSIGHRDALAITRDLQSSATPILTVPSGSPRKGAPKQKSEGLKRLLGKARR